MACLVHQNIPDSVGPCALGPGSPDLLKQVICVSIPLAGPCDATVVS